MPTLTEAVTSFEAKLTTVVDAFTASRVEQNSATSEVRVIKQAIDAAQTAINHKYRGALAADPATRTDGSANAAGDEYFSTTANLLKRWNGATWQASDINTENLAASGGAGLVGLPALGTSEVAGTVEEEAQRKAIEVRLLGHAHATQPAPRYLVLSTIADGQVSNAFPCAVRHGGFDYVFFRAGLQHTGNDGVIKVHKVNMDTGLLDSTATVLDLTVDSRDPCVLTDDYGRAVLVGGLMKVVVFHASANVATKVTVYDLDPANIAAGMVNPVDLPAGIVAAKTDVKPLAAGGYGLVGYSAANLCYWLTTTDFATFTIELIGAGNECAWGQQYDGTVVVVARQEVSPYHAKMYKKPLAGAWSLYSTLPFRLAAPTLRKTATTINSNETASTSGQHGGWLLLAKDRRESPNMNSLDAASVKLIALLSRNNYGTEINDFAIAQDVLAMYGSSIKNHPTGDSFYASAITGEFSSGLTIYAQMQVERDAFQANGSYVAKIVRVLAKFRPGVGLIVQQTAVQPPNKITNGDFNSANYWAVGVSSVIANSLLTITNTSLATTTNQVIKLKAGQYRLFTRAKRASGDGDGTNQHLYVKLLGAASALIAQVSMQGTAARLGSNFHILKSQPFDIAADGSYTVQVTGAAGTAVSVVDWVYAGNADDLFEFVDAQYQDTAVTASAALSGSVAGTPPVLTTTYSAAFWDLFGYLRDATGRPYAFSSMQDARDSLRVISAYDNSATPKSLLVRSFVVNANYSISVEFEQYQSQSAGTITAPVTLRVESRTKTTF